MSYTYDEIVKAFVALYGVYPFSDGLEAYDPETAAAQLWEALSDHAKEEIEDLIAYQPKGGKE